MRLQVIEDGHNRKQKLMLWLIRFYLPTVPGPILTMSYRPAFFGKYMARCLHEAMRKSENFDTSESELISAFVASTNECEY